MRARYRRRLTRFRSSCERRFWIVRVDASHDRSVMRGLIELAPPGIDELAAIVEVVEMIESEPDQTIVMDTAPTGHALRLLEMPALIHAWTKALMGILLKYQPMGGIEAFGPVLLRSVPRPRTASDPACRSRPNVICGRHSCRHASARGNARPGATPQSAEHPRSSTRGEFGRIRHMPALSIGSTRRTTPSRRDEAPGITCHAGAAGALGTPPATCVARPSPMAASLGSCFVNRKRRPPF